MQSLVGMLERELEYHKNCVLIVQELMSEVKRYLKLLIFSLPMNTQSSDNFSMKEISIDFADVAPVTAVAAVASFDKKLNYASKTGNMVFPTAGSISSSHNSRASSPISSARMSSQKKYVLVTFDFDAEGPGELTGMFSDFFLKILVRKGEIIEVTAEIDAGWWEGFICSAPARKGMFPSNYTM